MSEKRKAICLVSRAGDNFSHAPGDLIQVDSHEFDRLLAAGHIRPVDAEDEEGKTARTAKRQ